MGLNSVTLFSTVVFLIICEDLVDLFMHRSAVCVASDQNSGAWPWAAEPWRGGYFPKMNKWDTAYVPMIHCSDEHRH